MLQLGLFKNLVNSKFLVHPINIVNVEGICMVQVINAKHIC